MNRREFIGGVTALTAASSFAGLGTLKSQKPNLRVGILSDIHIMFVGNQQPQHPNTDALIKALKFFRDRGVDAVLISGDFTEYGEMRELEAVADAWRQVFPGNRGADGKIVERIFIRGNHDMMGGRADHKDRKAFPLVREDPAGAFKKCFDIDGYKAMRVQEVGGYKFLLVEWGTEWRMGEFFKSVEPTLPKDKPFFWVQHNHPMGTNIKPDCDLVGQSTEALKRWPNAIAISGHSHYPICLGDQIWQDEFTAVGAGSLAYSSVSVRKRAECTYLGGGKDGMYMMIYDDRVVFERHDFIYGTRIGPDWVVPLDGSRPYNWKKQKAERLPPEFPEGTVVTAKMTSTQEKGKKVDVLRLLFPRPKPATGDDGRTVDWEVKAFRPEDGEAKPLVVRHVYAQNFWFGDCKLASTNIIDFKPDAFKGAQKVRFSVAARNSWETAGKPIYGEYAFTK